MTTIHNFSSQKRETLSKRRRVIESNLVKLRKIGMDVERDVLVAGRPLDTMDAADILQDLEKMEVFLKKAKNEARKVLEMFK